MDQDHTRAAGILLHPTSFPGRHGIGDLGSAAFDWIDFLADTGTDLWQVLPLGPTGYGDSPYQCFSSFAGNPYLVDPEGLRRDGLLTTDDIEARPEFGEGDIDYGPAITWKVDLLDRAFAAFTERASVGLRADFDEFRTSQAGWIEDFATFMALKELNDLNPWWTWDTELRFAHPDVLATIRDREASRVDRHVFRQFLFFRQWAAVREHARTRGVSIVGDIPIFTAADSADVWANPYLFTVNEQRTGMETVAGVPPDYFSETGQLWGNPLYRWERHAREGFAWWLTRLRATFSMVDIVRVDHFRAFADYWEIPADAPTAVTGRWVEGPGMAFFDAVRNALGDLPIIAEDLGELSPAVPKLLQQTGLPGMKILEFGFDDDERSEFLPHNYPTHCVAYTGTHDNDTGQGWWDELDEERRAWAGRYLQTDGTDISLALIEGVWQSRAMYGIAPLQTFLRLDNEARMNTPGVPSGNWRWRYREGELTEELRAELRGLNDRYDRSAPTR